MQEILNSPNPSSLIYSLRNIGYTLKSAIADIIDNSITAKAPNVSVDFRWNNGDPWLAISDDGHGMSAENLTDAMRFGTQSPLKKRKKDDLGRFGLGLKTASISQCSSLTVASRKDGKLSVQEWDLDHITKRKCWSLKILDDKDVSKAPILSDLVSRKLNEAGTVVLWRQLDRLSEEAAGESQFNELMNEARKHVEMTFHRFISPKGRKQSISININEQQLEAFDPFGGMHPARQELATESLEINGHKVTIQPFVLPHHSKTNRQKYEQLSGEDGYLHNQGFYVYRSRRLILWGSWFGLVRKEELNKLVRVQVDIPNALDHLWDIRVDKSQLKPPPQVRKQLKQIIQKISGRGKEVYRRRGTKTRSGPVSPVWSRHVAKGQKLYRINRDHPLIDQILDSSEDLKGLESILRLIETSFPKDSFYADFSAAPEMFKKLEATPRETESLCLKLIDALREAGVEEKDLPAAVGSSEIPGLTKEIIKRTIKRN